MIELEINHEKRSLTDRYESWIAQRLQQLRQMGQEVWVRIYVGGDLNFLLPIGNCPPAGVGGGGLSPRQQELCNFFHRSGIENRPLNAGTLVSFLKELERFLRG